MLHSWHFNRNNAYTLLLLSNSLPYKAVYDSIYRYKYITDFVSALNCKNTETKETNKGCVGDLNDQTRLPFYKVVHSSYNASLIMEQTKHSSSVCMKWLAVT